MDDGSEFVHKLEDGGGRVGRGIFGANRGCVTGFEDGGDAEQSAELPFELPF